MSLVAVKGTKRETITDVLGTRIVKARPTRNDLAGLPNVDRNSLPETSVANTADMCFSLSFKETNSNAQATANPAHEGMIRNKSSTQGVITSNIEGILDMPETLPNNRAPSSAIHVKKPEDTSTVKKIEVVAKLYQ